MSDQTTPLEWENVVQALMIYLQLTPMRRSRFILKDVIGNSMAEISERLDGCVEASMGDGYGE